MERGEKKKTGDEMREEKRREEKIRGEQRGAEERKEATGEMRENR